MKVQAVVLAAGLSRRMGSPKMLLPWGTTTVLGHILRTLKKAGLPSPIVVVGGNREAVEAVCSAEGASAVFNAAFESGEMLSSLQTGLQSLSSDCQAALVVLGDQPSLQASVVERVLRAGEVAAAALIVPSYERRRGHPWLVGSNRWPEILRMKAPETARDFLKRNSAFIEYVEVGTDSILTDIDTPDQYRSSAP